MQSFHNCYASIPIVNCYLILDNLLWDAGKKSSNCIPCSNIPHALHNLMCGKLLHNCHLLVQTEAIFFTFSQFIVDKMTNFFVRDQNQTFLSLKDGIIYHFL